MFLDSTDQFSITAFLFFFFLKKKKNTKFSHEKVTSTQGQAAYPLSPRSATQIHSGKVNYQQTLWEGRKEVLIILLKTVLGEGGLSSSSHAGTEHGVSFTLVSFGASLKTKVAFGKQN